MSLDAPVNPDLRGPLPLQDEEYREYDFSGRIYRIDNPKEYYYRPGGETHRVVDFDGVAHCVPAPGVRGCVLRWKNRESASGPVQF